MAERPEDLNLPVAVVNRIVRDALPSNVKVSREANAAIAKAASVFVLYATSCTNNVATKSHRKTLQGSDVVQAITDMEFDKFVKPLENALDAWKSEQAKKKEESAKRKKEKETTTTTTSSSSASTSNSASNTPKKTPEKKSSSGAEAMDTSPPSSGKKAKLENKENKSKD